MSTTLTADKVIGKGLYAKKNINKLNSSLNKIGEIKKGDPVGVVWSYIQRGGKVYWMFVKPNESIDFLVLQEPDAFKLESNVSQVLGDLELIRQRDKTTNQTENKQTTDQDNEGIKPKNKLRNILLIGGIGILAFFLVTKYYIKKGKK
jgi:hypothetical protein